MKKLLLILLCLPIFFSSCVTTQYNTIRDCKTSDCIQKNYGSPNSIQNNGKFGEVWTYNLGDWLQPSRFKVYIDSNGNIYKTSMDASVKWHDGKTWAIILSSLAGLIIVLDSTD